MSAGPGTAGLLRRAEQSRTGNRTPERPVCQACGAWTCAACGWKRGGASRGVAQDCMRCGSTDGAMEPVRHHAGRGYYEQHNPATGPLCRYWTPETLPWHAPLQQFATGCGHRSCRLIAWNG